MKAPGKSLIRGWRRVRTAPTRGGAVLATVDRPGAYATAGDVEYVFGDAAEHYLGGYLAVVTAPKGVLDGETVGHLRPGRVVGRGVGMPDSMLVKDYEVGLNS